MESREGARVVKKTISRSQQRPDAVVKPCFTETRLDDHGLENHALPHSRIEKSPQGFDVALLEP
jgi:hypothetical protein